MNIISLELPDMGKLLSGQESYFLDYKSKEIAPAKLTKTISAFCNSSGGEVFVGLAEVVSPDGPTLEWNGFKNQEEANAHLQVLYDLDPLKNTIKAEFLSAPGASGFVLHLVIAKSQSVVVATDGKAYARVNASSIPLSAEALERLKYAKGVKTYEDELIDIPLSDVANSETIIEFLLSAIPTGEPEPWLEKQFLTTGGRCSVAGALLFADLPQAALPKRSAVKILRYKTKSDAERDYLAGNPETIEGPVYDLIYDSVERIKQIIEGVEKIGPDGMERVLYPHEAVHELLTNAVLHRDYSIAADVQVRIFDNRVEIESPGRLPGHVTVENLARTQFARNPKIVRIVNKFKNPPNKDVGEGINTAFEAMEKLRLKNPEFRENDASVTVILKHESLASPEQMVMGYLETNSEITNQIAREITGIRSENVMKNVFYRLRDRGQLEQTPKTPGKKVSWRKVAVPSQQMEPLPLQGGPASD